MKKFEWTEKYKIGIQIIDEQHKRFLEIANDILDLIGKENITKENIIEQAGRLGSYAHYHFNTEEDYFDKFAYKDAVTHTAVHNRFREKAKNYIDEAQKENTDAKSLILEMASFSGEWLLTHILEMDKDYTVYFIEHGLK